MAAILDGDERPLGRGSKGFSQVEVRDDLWFRDALMRQRGNDRPIYFLSRNRPMLLRTQEARRDSGGKECAE
jgi:hypothetical protein